MLNQDVTLRERSYRRAQNTTLRQALVGPPFRFAQGDTEVEPSGRSPVRLPARPPDRQSAR
jgi:hypothetical protein